MCACVIAVLYFQESARLLSMSSNPKTQKSGVPTEGRQHHYYVSRETGTTPSGFNNHHLPSVMGRGYGIQFLSKLWANGKSNGGMYTSFELMVRERVCEKRRRRFGFRHERVGRGVRQRKAPRPLDSCFVYLRLYETEAFPSFPSSTTHTTVGH